MGEAMLNDQDLEKIGLYVKSHFSEWARESNIIPFHPPRERSASMNQRFNQMFAYFTTGFVVLGVLISVYHFLG